MKSSMTNRESMYRRNKVSTLAGLAGCGGGINHVAILTVVITSSAINSVTEIALTLQHGGYHMIHFRDSPTNAFVSLIYCSVFVCAI